MENKSKKELIAIAQSLADEFNYKKSVIEHALNELDSKEKVGQEHYSGMVVIEELFQELDDIKLKQNEVLEQIKKG